jgi:hypothetical protein
LRQTRVPKRTRPPHLWHGRVGARWKAAASAATPINPRVARPKLVRLRITLRVIPDMPSVCGKWPPLASGTAPELSASPSKGRAVEAAWLQARLHRRGGLELSERLALGVGKRIGTGISGVPEAG